jgi:hypothetical protein
VVGISLHGQRLMLDLEYVSVYLSLNHQPYTPSHHCHLEPHTVELTADQTRIHPTLKRVEQSIDESVMAHLAHLTNRHTNHARRVEVVLIVTLLHTAMRQE